MKTLVIGGWEFPLKDYHCAGEDGVYYPKEDGKLWLYINLTGRCNASCPFCVNPAAKAGKENVNPERLRRVLAKIAPMVSGVSITGGEPMLFPSLVEETAAAVLETLGVWTRLEMVTNGTNLEKLPNLSCFPGFTSVHISRHRVSDEENRRVMGFSAPTAAAIRSLVAGLKDPGKIVFNCVLSKSGVSTGENVKDYLEMAAWAGVQNTSFVGMMPANAYCREEFVSPASLCLPQSFALWSEYRDHDYCRCRSGHYETAHGIVRFYYRCPGGVKAPYARQLVYNNDNRLLAGFGGEELPLVTL